MNRTYRDVLAMIERLNKSIERNAQDEELLAYLLQFRCWFELMQYNSSSKWQKDKFRFEDLKIIIQFEYKNANKYNDYQVDTAKIHEMTNEYLTLQRKWKF